MDEVEETQDDDDTVAQVVLALYKLRYKQPHPYNNG